MKKFFAICAVFGALFSCFAQNGSVLNSKIAKLENKKIPILLMIDSSEVVSKSCYPVCALSFEKDKKQIEETFGESVITIYNKIFDEASNVSDIVFSPKDEKKASGIIARLGDKKQLEIPYIIATQDCIIMPFKSPASKLRPDMMFAALRPDEKGVLKWDVSLRSPAVMSLLESYQKSGILERRPIDVDILGFIDISNEKNLDCKVLRIYKAWQKKFYELNLDAYAEYMTPKSKEIYTKQYLNMSKEEQAETLKDYITYTKTFYKIAHLDEVDIVLFTRHDKGKINSYDAAFILNTCGDCYKLANFGQNQGKFADYLISKIHEWTGEKK